MERISVLGIGNRLMMDDGIGVYITEELQQNSSLPVEYIVGETDVDYCLEQVDPTAFLVVIDAVEMDKEIGSITTYPLSDIPKMEIGISGHNLHVFHFLRAQKQKGLLVGIEPFCIEFHDGLSPPLKEKFPQLVKNMHLLIENMIKE